MTVRLLQLPLCPVKTETHPQVHIITIPVLLRVVVALLCKLRALFCQQEAPRDGVVALQVVRAQHVWLEVLVGGAVVEPLVHHLLGEVYGAAC